MAATAMSLSQQISSLCDPTPSLSEPQYDSDNDDSNARLCQYSEEDEDDTDIVSLGRKRRSSLRRDRFESDPKYAGKLVSRKALKKKWEIGDIADVGEEDEIDSSEVDLEPDDNSEDVELDDSELDEDDNLGEAEFDSEEMESEEDMMEGEDEENIEEHSQVNATTDRSNIAGSDNGGDDDGLLFKLDEDVTAKLRESATEDMEKGKAVRNQLSVWDGLLEGRIRLQKVLPLVNRLPQGEMMDIFREEGKEAITEKLKMSHSELLKLLDSLLELQKTLLTQNTATRHIITGESPSGSHGNHQDDEEIPSDTSDEETTPETIPKHTNHHKSVTATKAHRRNNTNEWAESREDYIEELHKRFNPHRNETITKWNEKLKLASGKMTSKAFQHFDRSIMAHIEYVLNDKQRLRKRTQLKRSSYTVLGQEVAVAMKKKDTPSEDTPTINEQLKEYDEEIFDDSDFYHQLLKELIDRKTSHNDTDDPIEMGRQWLELQKLRTKVKKKVDTKASKGRKLRYEVHPKLTNFMTPIDKGSMSDSSRNDLFSSLFGSRHTLN